MPNGQCNTVLIQQDPNDPSSMQTLHLLHPLFILILQASKLPRSNLYSCPSLFHNKKRSLSMPISSSSCHCTRSPSMVLIFSSLHPALTCSYFTNTIDPTAFTWVTSCIWQMYRRSCSLCPYLAITWDICIDSNNSLDSELVTDFYLNNFANKDTFHSILSYQ